MKIVFRVDASQEIGSGHVMRCLSIAEEALSQGIECVFIGSITGVSWLSNRLSEYNIGIFLDQEDYVPNKNQDLLVIDSYIIPVNDPFLNKSKWKNVVALIDETSPLYDADMYIHPGSDDKWFLGDKSKMLSGRDYIPLRKSIKRIKNSDLLSLKKIVVTGGGSDSFNFALEMATALQGLRGFDQVIYFSTEVNQIQEMDKRFLVKGFGGALDIELDTCELAFATASTSSLEIVARGLPLGIGCAVENQLQNYRSLKNEGVATQIGERVSTGSWRLHTSAIEKLVLDPALRGLHVMNSAKSVNLQGSRRIIAAINGLAS